MAEKIGSIYYDLDLNDAKFKKGISGASQQTKSFGQHLKDSAFQLAALGAVATLAFRRIKSGIDAALDASIKTQNALIGLNSVASAFGQDADKAKLAAKSLASDGLMPIGDAAASLKNLLAAGFNLDQAIELMNRFKDTAAFGRQGALAFGESIRGATEGIKNGNSILVDNAGITKNLSVILQEAGFSAQDLMRASTDAGVRQAIFNGILKEAAPMFGDAAKLSESFGGAMARAETDAFNLKAAIGEALQPLMTKLLEKLAPVVKAFIDFATNNPQVVSAIIAIVTAGVLLVAFLGILGAIVGALMNLAPLFIALAGVVAGITAPALLVIGAVLIGVIALVMAMRKHWTTIVTLFNAYLKPALASILASLKDLWASLMQLWNTLKPILIPILKVLGVILLVVLGAAIASIVAQIWIFVNVLKIVIGVFQWLVNTILGAVSGAWQAIQSFWDSVTGAFNDIKDMITTVIDAFKGIIGSIEDALKGAGEAIMKPFRGAFDWIQEKAGKVGGFLQKLNPFHRESPSLVDWITKGTEKITGLYGDMFNQLETMSVQGRGALRGSVQALAGSSGGSSGEGAIASQPLIIQPNFNGIVARSRGEWRDIVADGIEAVNEDLRSRGITEIGGGKVAGSSTNG